MLTRLRIRNFKKLGEIDIPLDRAVVFIGPNNSGKTTALQALALWEIGVRRWNEKRAGKSAPGRRPGVTINRRDLVSVPVPTANLLWRDLHVREGVRTEEDDGGGRKTLNVRIEVDVEGVDHDKSWRCGLEFDYANEESFYCRPLRTGTSDNERMPVPDAAGSVKVAFLPPMSGLEDREYLKQRGEIDVLVGQGRTAQVLRNLCYDLATNAPESWKIVQARVGELFGVAIRDPEYVAERSEISMFYEDGRGVLLDISSSGRGLQQTLLLLAFLHANRGAVLLLDEPDAHLEILRQRQTYNLIATTARELGCQVVAASHSEVVLNEAAERDLVIAFVGTPHQIADRGSQLLKSLRDIGFEHYYQAQQTGWILYVEDSTDFAVLRAFSQALNHPAAKLLERAFVNYVGTNLPQRAREHFYGLREAKSDLVGIAIFDRLDKQLKDEGPLRELMWRRNEIENYFCTRETLLNYAGGSDDEDMFAAAEAENRHAAMSKAIDDVTQALATLGKPDPWSEDIKASTDFLDVVFRKYFESLGLPLVLRKSEYFRLAAMMPAQAIPREVTEKLDLIAETASKARPAESA